MGIILESGLTEILILVTSVLLLITSYFHNSYKYWNNRGVPTVPPRFPIGNNNILLPKGFTIGTISKSYYDFLKKRGHRFGGVYLVTEPNLVIIDPDLVKDVLSKDFNYFVDRGFYFNEGDDPISANLFAVDGEKWRQLRTKLTPTFTSSKMKMMFHSVINCSKFMLQAVENHALEDSDIDMKEILGRYTTDVIGSCIFGVECNSFQHPDAEFRKMGKRIFHFDLCRSIRAFLIANVPKFAHFLRLTNNNKDIRDFFTKLVADSIKIRKKLNVRRNDFIQILMDLGDSANFSLNEMAAQAFLFFLAGFESSSVVMSLALYQLAKNPDYQNKLRQEIGETLEKHDDEFTYESISEMKFMGQIFDETLRMYPPGVTLNRRAVKNYQLKDSNIVVEKGTPILISPLGLHHDPEYYPDPENFDPERFSEENKKSRRPGVYLPFGDGPRNCIGMRFGTMQSKIGIASIIKNFKIYESPNLKKITLDPTYFTLKTTDPVLLRAEKI